MNLTKAIQFLNLLCYIFVSKSDVVQKNRILNPISLGDGSPKYPTIHDREVSTLNISSPDYYKAVSCQIKNEDKLFTLYNEMSNGLYIIKMELTNINDSNYTKIFENKVLDINNSGSHQKDYHCACLGARNDDYPKGFIVIIWTASTSPKTVKAKIIKENFDVIYDVFDVATQHGYDQISTGVGILADGHTVVFGFKSEIQGGIVGGEVYFRAFNVKTGVFQSNANKQVNVDSQEKHYYVQILPATNNNFSCVYQGIKYDINTNTSYGQRVYARFFTYAGENPQGESYWTAGAEKRIFKNDSLNYIQSHPIGIIYKERI